MKKAFLSILILTGLTIVAVIAPLEAQGWGHHGSFGRHSFFPGFGPGQHRTHVGIFPISPGFRPKVFFGGFRTTHRSGRHSRFAWRDGFWAPYRISAYRPELKYTSEKFVAEWADREPSVLQPGSRIEQSLILSRGMSEEDVVRVLGSPLQRIQLEDREVWKYSSYSLLFEAGALMEIR